MPRNLTDRYIANLKPGAKRYHKGDTQVPGLTVRVHPTGRKVFTIVVRRNGRPLWREVNGAGQGQYGIISLEEARAGAREGIRRAKQGLEPYPNPEPAPEPESYEAVVADFIVKYAKVKQRTWRETERVLKSLPWAEMPFTDISKRDAYAVLDGFIADGHGAKAVVTLSWLRKLWRWAAQRDIIEASVMDGVIIETEREIRTRVYTDAEIAALWNAPGLTGQSRAFVKLLTLTGVRKGELAGMRLDELDDPVHPFLWTIPFERTKSKKTARPRTYLVPLVPLAQRVLKPLLASADPLVFPGRHEGRPIEAGESLRRRVRRHSGIADWYAHAHRDTLATWMQDEGASEYERGLVLNHAGGGGATTDYSHGFSVELKRKWMERWAEHVAEVVQPEGAALLA